MLTDRYISQLKPKSQNYKAYDTKGLYLLIKPDGSKLWRLRYKHDGRTRKLKGPSYSAFDLQAARDWGTQAKFSFNDSSVAKPRRAKRQGLVNTDDSAFERIARDWFQHASRHWSGNYARRTLQSLERDIFPVLGNIPIDAVDGPSLRAALKKVEQRGALEVCRRLRSHCGSIFSFAIAEGQADRDPSTSIIDALPKRNLNSHRSALKASRVPAFFAALTNEKNSSITDYAILWTMLTVVRSVETRFARYDELEGLDGLTPQWRIPCERVKTGVEHIVPLSKQAIRLLRDIREASPRSEYLFPSEATHDGVIGHSRMLDGIKRVGFRGEATIHGFRGLASTVLNEATRVDDRGEVVRLWDSDWVERQLAHVESRQSRRAYNAAEWIGPRRRMMQWWSDWLDCRGYSELRAPPADLSRAYQFVI